MPRDGTQTRESLLDAAHSLTLRQGFSATSIDQLLAHTGLTKGAFFHHFKNKAELAHALVLRYAEVENRFLADCVGRAEKLGRDSVSQLLLIVGLAAELFEDLDSPHPGCLFGSFCYQNELLDPEVMEVVSEAMLEWRRVLLLKLRQAATERPPPAGTDLEAVADMFLTVFEGAFVMSRVLDQPDLVVRQLRNYRDYLELLFSPP
jgi:TetR/AcrR family transcriptional repressor of nem operon